MQIAYFNSGSAGTLKLSWYIFLISNFCSESMLFCQLHVFAAFPKYYISVQEENSYRSSFSGVLDLSLNITKSNNCA